MPNICMSLPARSNRHQRWLKPGGALVKCEMCLGNNLFMWEQRFLSQKRAFKTKPTTSLRGNCRASHQTSLTQFLQPSERQLFVLCNKF